MARTTLDDTYKGSTQSASDNDTNAVLQLQYNMALTDGFVLGFGGSINMGDLKAGKFGNNQDKLTDGYSLYVAPGYAFNSSWMGYGKIAYLNATAKNSGGNSLSFDNGWGYGLGAQVLFNKNWFGQVEFMANDYGSKNFSSVESVKIKSDVFSLSVGYKF
jgi:opacity protein-like surface antigen